MASKNAVPFISRVRAIWKKLTSPAFPPDDLDQRQHVRLLLSVLVFIIIPGLPIVLLSLWLTQPQIPLTWLLLSGLINEVVFISLYGFSRRGHYQRCGGLAPTYMSFSLLVSAALLHNQAGVQLLYYLVTAPLFASLILSVRQVALITSVQMIGMAALGLVLPGTTYNLMIAGPFSFNLTVGIMIGLVVSYYRRLEGQRRVQLLTSERQQRNLIEELRDMVFTQAVTGEITALNSAAANLLGFKVEELIGRAVTDFIHPDDLSLALSIFKHMLHGQTPPLFELRLFTRSGGYVWVEFKATPILEAGRLLSITGVARDISERKQMEASLRETNHMLQVVVTNSPLPIIILNRNTQITLWNPAAERIFGWKEREILNQPYPLVPPDREAEYGRFLDEVLHQGRTILSQETHRQRKDGSLIDVSISGGPVRNAQGSITGIIVLFEDITERKRTEAALRESENRYRIISELMSDYAYATDVATDGSLIIEWMTESFETVTGYTAEEMQFRPNLFPFHPDDVERVRQHVLEVLRGQSVSGEYRYVTKSGEIRWLNMYRRPVWDADQQRVVRYYAVAKDITARKEAEAALKASEERYRIISESISDYAYAKRVEADGSRRMEWVTNSFENITGYSKEELLSGQRASLYHPDDADRAFQDVLKVLQGQPVSAEYRIITRDKRVHWLNVYRRPVWDAAENRVIRYYGVAQDITQRKEAEAALKASEERYRIISELISDYAYSTRIDDNGVSITEWMTSSLSAVTGYSEEEAKFQRPFSTYHPDDIEQVQADIQRVLQGHSINGEYRYLAQDGRIHWLRMYRRPAWDDNQQRVFRYYTVAQDITERKEAEAALRASEERYRIVSELISDYAYSIRVQRDGSTVYDWMTDSFKNVTGYNWEEITPTDPFSLYYPDDYNVAQRDVALVKQGKTITGEYRIITKRGQTRWVLISRHPVWDAAQNRVTRYYGVAQDITERKEAESQKMRLALQRERLMLLGQFVRAVSHDFRTTLANIETSRYLIERQLTPEVRDGIQPRLDRIHVSVKRLTTQLENLYSVSAVANPNTDLCDVNGLIDALLDEQRPLAYQKKVALRFDRHPFLPLIPANADELKRALQHLVVNALNFTPEGGQITLRTSHSGENLIIEVHDTGVGIADENQPFIFDLFYRADASRTIESGGIGLGLSIVKMIVEAHGGEITLDSVVGRGTLFVITLPTSQLDMPVTEAQPETISRLPPVAADTVEPV